jgi:xylulokinase
MSIMGLDIGSSGCKTQVYSEKGKLIASSRASYRSYSPRPGWMELDPNLLWRKVRYIIRDAAGMAEESKDPVSVLSMATMGDSLVAVRSDGTPMGPYILYSDRRSAAQTDRIVRRMGREKLFAITGMPPHPMNTLTKILWLKDNDPDLFHSAARFLCVEDFITTRLGLPPTTSFSNASRTMAFSLSECRWSEDILSAANLERGRLPEAVPSGTVIGAVETGVARALGLRDRVQLVAGGLDQACGIVGADAASFGSVQNAMGTQEILAFSMPVGMLSPGMCRRLLEGRYSVNRHVLPDAYMIMGMIINPGLLLRWAALTLRGSGGGGTRSLDARIEAALTDRPPCHVTVLPSISGRGTPEMNASASGVIFGLDPGVSGLDILQSILQGIAYEAAINVEVMEAMGLPITSFKCVGGGARSDACLQLRSDVLSREVTRMRDAEAAAVGAAALAGVGSGVWQSVTQAARLLNAEQRLFRPNPVHAAFYREQKELHVRLNQALKRSFAGSMRLARAGERA